MEKELKTPFTPQQMQILKLTEFASQEDIDEIRKIVVKYFADKVQKMADELWDQGVINEEVIESWKHEHMRTPYRFAKV